MTVPKLHHYVPQFYLRRFTNSKGRFWVWDKKTDRIFQSTPKAVAAELNFYKLTDADRSNGDPMMMERHFSELESDVALITDQWLGWLVDRPARKKIPIPKTNRWLVSMYISLQFFRTADTKDIICLLEQGIPEGRTSEKDRYDIFASYLSNMDALIDNMIEKVENPEAKVTTPLMSEKARRESHTKFLYDPNFVILLADRIDRSIWIFGRNRSGNPFVTSDNPVAFKTGDHKMWVKGALLSPGTYTVFPLSPEIVLYCHDLHPPFDKLKKFDRSVSPVEFDSELVEQDNTGQVFMASRFVISPINDFSFARDFVKTIGTDKYAPPELKRKTAKKKSS
jgi:hypothetical protein